MKIKLLIIFLLIALLLTGCGGNQIYPNLKYQDSYTLTARKTDIYVFTNKNGDQVVLYDRANSIYKNLMDKGQVYDVEVSVESSFSYADYIRGISKSK